MRRGGWLSSAGQSGAGGVVGAGAGDGAGIEGGDEGEGVVGRCDGSAAAAGNVQIRTRGQVDHRWDHQE